MKKKITVIVQFIFPSIIIGKVLVTNFVKIKRANRIFINSQGFGHSVIDTIAYLEHYGEKSVVISLGTNMGQSPGAERNLYFEYYFDKYSIIQLHIPALFFRKKNWRFIHPITKYILKVFCVVIRNDQIVIDEHNEKINMEVLPKRIATHMQISVETSQKILNEMYKDFKLAENHYQSPHTINFLLKQPLRDIKVLDQFLDSSVRKKLNTNFDQKLFVCLTIRRGNAPYHSTANYYFSVVEFLYSQGYEIYLLGDRDFFLNSVHAKRPDCIQSIINFDLGKSDSKILDVFAVSKCAFVLGDQGGVWSLVSALNRPGLIINSSCVAHLQFNVESLPRKWIYAESKLEFVDAQMLFSELFYRYKPTLISENGSEIIQSENDLSFILDVVDRYTSKYEYLAKREMNEKICHNFPDNNQIYIAKNSSYSPEYIDKLVF